MKKIFFALFLLFFMCLNTAKAFDLPAKAPSGWTSMTSQKRNEIIDEGLKKINSSNTVDISDENLTNLFGERYSKDKNYKEHRDGENTSTDIKPEIVRRRYINASGSYEEINAGYSLYKNNIKLVYNTAGSLVNIVAYSDNYPSFPYVIKKYNSSGKLLNSAYCDKPYFTPKPMQIIYKDNGTFFGVSFGNVTYDKNGKYITGHIEF